MTTDPDDFYDPAAEAESAVETVAGPPPTPGEVAEHQARLSAASIDQLLADKRAHRDQIAAEIKVLVKERETLQQVLRAYDRAKKPSS